MPRVPPAPGRVREACLAEVISTYTSGINHPEAKCLEVFFVITTLEMHIPVSREPPCLRKSQALLCLPAKNSNRMSSLAQCPPKTEVPVSGTGRAQHEVTYIFTVKTIQADFPQFTLQGDKTHR